MTDKTFFHHLMKERNSYLPSGIVEWNSLEPILIEIKSNANVMAFPTSLHPITIDFDNNKTINCITQYDELGDRFVEWALVWQLL